MGGKIDSIGGRGLGKSAWMVLSLWHDICCQVREIEKERESKGKILCNYMDRLSIITII